MKASDLALELDGILEGNPDFPVKKPVPVKVAGPEDVTFLFDEKFDEEKEFGLLIATFRPRKSKYSALILVKNKDEAMIKVLRHFEKKDEFDIANPVSPEAEISEDVKIPPFCFIGKRVKIGKGTRIHPFVFIGCDSEIGENVTIYPFVYIGHDVKVGSNTTIFSGAVIGADGFGFYRMQSRYIKIPQVGGVIIEEDCEIGANATIDRATIGYTIIRKGTKLDDQVHVGHNVEIGEHTVIAGQTGIAGSTKVGNWVMMGGQVGIADHLEIGDNIIILAKAGVAKSLEGPGIYGGYFARERSKFLKIRALEEKLPEIYERLKRLEEKVEGKDNKEKD